MKIGILSSNRADFGIYLPLIEEIKKHPEYTLELIVFGGHFNYHDTTNGTFKEIESLGYQIKHKLHTAPENDQPEDIANNIGVTTSLFANFWKNNSFDWVFALGDRYEMFAAVSGGLCFNVRFAHIHGGETTLGAIDNVFRHSISLMSKIVFVSCDKYAVRASQILGGNSNIFNVGALSIDNLKHKNFLTPEEISQKFDLDLNQPSILITFHPETVAFSKNVIYIEQIVNALEELQKKYQLIITLPNNDTLGSVISNAFKNFKSRHPQTYLIDSFGMIGYLSVMRHCSFMLGNTSSGFVEASYFPKYVINLGTRQSGRVITPNIFNCEINSGAILETVAHIETLGTPTKIEYYGDGNTACKIIKTIKELNRDE